MSKYTTVRLTPEQRKNQILDSAFKLAQGGNLMTMSIANIAQGCPVKCSKSTVKYYFSSLAGIRHAVIRMAIIRGDLDILAVAIVNKEPAADLMHDDLRNAALKTLV